MGRGISEGSAASSIFIAAVPEMVGQHLFVKQCAQLIGCVTLGRKKSFILQHSDSARA